MFRGMFRKRPNRIGQQRTKTSQERLHEMLERMKRSEQHRDEESADTSTSWGYDADGRHVEE